jgi:hypothetical protein
VFEAFHHDDHDDHEGDWVKRLPDESAQPTLQRRSVEIEQNGLTQSGEFPHLRSLFPDNASRDAPMTSFVVFVVNRNEK